MPKGRWVACTPDWVTEWDNACGSTVRRPVLVPRAQGLDIFTAPAYDAVGHEHLMIVFETLGHMTPLAHESGEPA